MEQNTTIAELIKHLYVIRIFTGHKTRLTNIEIAKAVLALNPHLFEHMNFQKIKDYYKVYMHIYRNVLAEYQKIKKAKEN